MEFYIKYMKDNNISNNLRDIVRQTSQHPILEDYLKIYLKTEEGKKELNLQDINGWTALMRASLFSKTYSSIETVKLLIENGANVNLQNNNGDTALILVASQYSNIYSSIETVKLLIENGANVNIQNNNGETVLMFALKYLDKDILIETVKLLIEYGLNLYLQNKNNDTVLMLILKYLYQNNKLIEILKLILNQL